ncbi:MAG TPA: type II toxin-antitoxin system VapC family toxin [Gammaproteobacteria bacterium]|nr:type II toxin-antitoxin system VapC family toxin [Gammaproteobacteria bacterium]
MIILDTNVISELIRPKPDTAVLSWLDKQPADDLFITAISVAELLYGTHRLPDGKRKTALRDSIEAMLEKYFSDTIAPFDTQAAIIYAELVAEHEKQGRMISMADAQIAAICRNHQTILATRNIKDFTHLGISLINPWKDSK